MSKALEILKEYATIDFGCNMEEHHKRIDEAIKELKALQQRSCEVCLYYEKDYLPNTGLCMKNIGCGYCITNLVDNNFCCNKFEPK